MLANRAGRIFSVDPLTIDFNSGLQVKQEVFVTRLLALAYVCSSMKAKGLGLSALGQR